MTGPGDKVRTFIAILIPDAARQALAECIQHLSGLAPQGVRWVDPEGIHLTLRFLGDIPVERVEDVLAAQGVAAGCHEPFSLQLSGLGMFPNSDRPRVLWAGVSGDMDALRLLQEEVEAQLERVGFPRDRRPFAPHLTLGRIRNRASSVERQRIAAATGSVALGHAMPWLVEESHLIRSTLTPQGGHLHVVGGSAPVLGHRIKVLFMETTHAHISPAAPFDFELTAGYHTYFQGRYGTDSLDQGVYRRLLDLDGRLVLASVSSVGSVDSPELLVELEGEGLDSTMTDAAAARICWLLGVGQDLAPFYKLAQQDPTMSAVVDRFRGLHLPHTASVFEALVLGILGQQISTSVARVIRTLLIETYGPSANFGGETYYAFPHPESLAAATLEELRGLKLSRSKAEYAQGVAAETLNSPGLTLCGLDGLEDEEVVRRVVQLRGVGRWTAQWLLIRGLGRPDALPLGDLALRRVVSQLYFDNQPVDDRMVEDFCRQWSPWRSFATVYWFAALRRGMA